MSGEKKTTIEDVRLALWNAYNHIKNKEGTVDGKSAEGSIEVVFDTYWNCETEEEFTRPIELRIYSYVLGPSRMHYFYRDDKYKTLNYRSWCGPDIYQLAIDKIKEWTRTYDEKEED